MKEDNKNIKKAIDPIEENMPVDKKKKSNKSGGAKNNEKKGKTNKIGALSENDKLEKFDPRGIQTLFRTLSRNHYQLLKMVDTKASIILTINSIIISLLMGALYILSDSERAILTIGAKILINFSLISMVFALIAMLPHRYLGKRFKKSGYKGSLYAANFVDQSLDEFKVEFERIMNNGKSVYDEMVTDLYFLGKSINRKQLMLIIAVFIFLIGLMATFVIITINGFKTI